MPIAFTLAGLAVLLAIGLLAVGRLGELPEAHPDRAPLALPPDRAMTDEDVQEVRFAVGARGYRMDEVDAVLDRVGADLAERDAHIGFLQRQFEVAGIDPYAEAGLAGGDDAAGAAYAGAAASPEPPEHPPGPDRPDRAEGPGPPDPTAPATP